MIVEVHVMTEMSDFLVPLKAQFNMKKKKTCSRHKNNASIHSFLLFIHFIKI